LYRKEIEGPQGVAALTARLDEANSAAKGRRIIAGQGAIRGGDRSADDASGRPAALREQVIAQRDQSNTASRRQVGPRRLRECRASVQFVVKGRSLQIAWPPFGDFEERVLNADQREVVSVVVSAGKYQGRLSGYAPAAKGLTITEHRRRPQRDAEALRLNAARTGVRNDGEEHNICEVRVQVAQARTTLHLAAGGRRVAAERDGHRGTTGAGCRSIDWRGRFGSAVAWCRWSGMGGLAGRAQVGGQARGQAPAESRASAKVRAKVQANSQNFVTARSQDRATPPGNRSFARRQYAGGQSGQEPRRSLPRLQRLPGDGCRSCRQLSDGLARERARARQ
jgi:hypothetical protein